MRQRPPGATRTDTRFPYPTLFRAAVAQPVRARPAECGARAARASRSVARAVGVTRACGNRAGWWSPAKWRPPAVSASCAVVRGEHLRGHDHATGAVRAIEIGRAHV